MGKEREKKKGREREKKRERRLIFSLYVCFELLLLQHTEVLDTARERKIRGKHCSAIQLAQKFSGGLRPPSPPPLGGDPPDPPATLRVAMGIPLKGPFRGKIIPLKVGPAIGLRDFPNLYNRRRAGTPYAGGAPLYK